MMIEHIGSALRFGKDAVSESLVGQEYLRELVYLMCHGVAFDDAIAMSTIDRTELLEAIGSVMAREMRL